MQKLRGDSMTNKYAKESASKIVENMLVPDSLIEQVADFDPIMCVESVLENHFPPLLRFVLGHQGPEDEFISEVQKMGSAMFSEVVADLQNGFEKWEDVEAFLKANVHELLTVASDPAQAGLITMFGVPAIMKFLI